MAEITLSNDIVQYIAVASKHIKTSIIDCLETDDKLVFVVGKGQLGVAIGSNAKNLDKLRNLFKKNIRFVEFDKDEKKFIYNLFRPYKINNVNFEGNDDAHVARVEVDSRDKSRIIGKGGKNIELIRKLAQRHHSIKDVQIV
ncbi:NusA family KH domain protein [Thermoplasmatales archaeon SCGC AB-539-N05]|nr:NusA family KH domain protein [Thermoplasmatales archaeon SCGC AB-539-N05]ENO11798.1 NusA family KH domain protein [Thermoplasmatales archaeon SCGC AB-539-C06]